MRRILLYSFLFIAASANAAIPSSERNALTALYNATGGGNWTTRTNWLGAVGTECTWYGVRCSDDQSAITGIFLASNNLSGSLPPDIGAFSKLTELELYSNRIGGSLPPQIGSLTELQRLALFSNRFTGLVPREIGQLAKLTYFALGDNQFTGAIPPELGNLVNVEFFSFNGSLLDGPIPPELGRLAKVQTLDLAYGRIGGPIPRELGQLPNVFELYLNDNQLMGTIPSELGQLITLRQLNLSLNRLTGSIPPSLGKLTDLRTLSVAVNQLSGAIPVELASLMRLERLSLRQNQLTGTIPSELSRMSSLTELEMGSNQLAGAIPPELGQLSNLQRLNLEGNQLTGGIPREIGRLANLGVLSVGGNQLTGSLPQELTSLKNLFSLSFDSNRITGPIPPGITSLQNLVELVAFGNQLTGPIPSDIGALTKLRQLLLGGNQLTGTIPPSIVNLTELTFLDLRGNQFTGPMPTDIDRMSKLENLSVFGNQLTGPIPPAIGKINTLTTLRLEDNDFEGVIPPGITDLTKLEFLGLRNNHLQGSIPAAMGKLTNLQTLWLGGNRFGGAIPAEVGMLTKLTWIDLGNNRLSGAVPRELANLTNLPDNFLDLGYNLLFTDDASLRAFLNRKQSGGDWERTQTRPPSNVAVSSVTDRSAIVSWSLASYTDDDGGYQVTVATGGLPVTVATTASKLLSSILVRGLRPMTTYSVTVRTVTHPHGLQQNTLTSDATSPVTFVTTAAVVAPASIELTASTSGLVQRGGVPENEDTFTLSNSGDVSTSITLATSGDFFELSTTSFTLSGGASQTVRVKSLSRAPGAYSGEVIPKGTGVPDGLSIPIQLLSVAAPAGTAIAQPAATRIDLSGDPSSDSTATIRFTNSGTAPLTGIVVSDVPWLEPPKNQITIPPGGSVDVTFRVVRSKRPASDGAIAGSLRLVYLGGSTGTSLLSYDGAIPLNGGLSVSTVTVVDTTKPSVGSSTIPPLAPGEVARFIPGIFNSVSGANRLVSDLFVSNSFGVAGVRDLRLYFSDIRSSASPSVASFSRLEPSQSLQLASVVSSVYSSAATLGTLQIRTVEWNKLLVNATLSDLRAAGSFTSSLPVFRSDRAVAAGEQLVLTGLEKSDQRRTDMYLQETAGNSATATIELLDAQGRRVGDVKNVALTPYGMSEAVDAAGAGAVTAIVTNASGSAGRLTGYALVSDLKSGDRWSLVDWSRFYAFGATQPVKVPLVQGSGITFGRRRAVPHDAQSSTPRAQSDLVLFNVENAPGVVTIAHYNARGSVVTRDIALAPRETKVLKDLAGLFSRSGSGYVVVSPLRGRIAASSRAYIDSGGVTYGSAVPLRADTAGLRLGQSQIFAGIEDAASATVTARRAGTYRTGFGVVESEGQSVKVRATLLYTDGRSVYSTNFSGDYEVAPRGLLFIDSLAGSILGTLRDTLGDLRNLQVTFEVVEGSGAATIFLLSTENGTGDTILRLE